MIKFIKKVLIVCDACGDFNDKKKFNYNLKQEEQELKESIEYYKAKLESLEQTSVNSKKNYYMLGVIVL